MPKSSSLGHSLSVYVSECSIIINKMNLNKFNCQFGFYSLSVSLFPSFLLSCSLLNVFHVLVALLGDSFLVSFVRSSSYMKPNNDYTLLSDVGVSSRPCLGDILFEHTHWVTCRKPQKFISYCANANCVPPAKNDRTNVELGLQSQ